jgi:formylglycine-generating enzyme required for sulfatase activity
MSTLLFGCLVACLSADPIPDADHQLVLRTFREEFLEITPGTGRFPSQSLMGSDSDKTAQPPRQIVMADPFLIAKYEVTQSLWESVMGDNPSRWKGPRNSVEMVSFTDAQVFCERVTSLLREAKFIGEKQSVRLPTEREWEYAARAGTTTRYSFGDDASALPDYAWFTENAAGNDPPVGAKRPNPWGLFDMHGYLWEWCLPSAEYTRPAVDGHAVLRGGSWKDAAERLTSCHRRVAATETKDDAIGFRCVLSGSAP